MQVISNFGKKNITNEKWDKVMTFGHEFWHMDFAVVIFGKSWFINQPPLTSTDWQKWYSVLIDYQYNSRLWYLAGDKSIFLMLCRNYS